MLKIADILLTIRYDNITTESIQCAFVWRIIFFVLKINVTIIIMHALDYNSSLCYVDWFHNRSVIAALICIFSSFKFLDFIQFCVQVYEMITKNKYNIYCTFRFEFCFFFKFLILLVTTTRNCFGFLGSRRHCRIDIFYLWN